VPAAQAVVAAVVVAVVEVADAKQVEETQALAVRSAPRPRLALR